MTRETCKPDLARTVAVLPYLRYVDLPEGIFTDDPTCNTLKQEIQARCPDLRKMSYMGGSERSLELLAVGTTWRNLEVLELSKLNMDPTILRRVLGALPSLRALKISDMRSFNDQSFQDNDYLPPFPPVTELLFNNTPNVTAEGLAAYLSRSEAQKALKTLSLTTTGVHPSTLYQVLETAPKLTHLSIIESVDSSFPADSHIQPLSSTSLQILHYEITSASSANSYASTTTSYYTYLTSSLISNSLPNLRELYVRDPDFPESLIDLAPPTPAFIADYPSPMRSPISPIRSPNSSMLSPNSPMQSPFSSNNPFAAPALKQMQQTPGFGPGLKQELVVYSKGLDEMEWNFSRVQPPKDRNKRGSATAPRPVSSYGLGDNMGRSWGVNGGARQSVIVGNGFGGFLAVPADEIGGSPRSSAGEKRRGSQIDMWR